MLRLELLIASVLAVGKQTLEFYWRTGGRAFCRSFRKNFRKFLRLQVSVSHFDIVKGIYCNGWEFRIEAQEARDMDTKLLSALESKNTLARFLGQMAHLVASITLNSASIRPKGFLSSVLMWLVIIVAVVGVGVTSDGKIRLPSSGPQFRDITSLSKAS
ncbi:hypothetical protein Tco_0928753 [Tanacetum coccineum]